MNWTFWVVQVMRHWDSLSAGPWRIGGMDGAKGCVGFMPIFDSYTAACEWRDENHPTARIAEIGYHVEPEEVAYG